MVPVHNTMHLDDIDIHCQHNMKVIMEKRMHHPADRAFIHSMNT